MRTKQWVWKRADGWSALEEEESPPSVVFVLGGRRALEEGKAIDALARWLPRERFFGCSTAGEIDGSTVCDDTVVATAVWFERSSVVTSSATLSEAGDSTTLGRLLVQRLPSKDVVHGLVFSDGLLVNGSALVRGMMAELPERTSISGGLSGDGIEFGRTVTIHAGTVVHGGVSLLGFRGAVQVGTGSLGGWEPFGPMRAVTKASGNVLEALDGEPALALYKRYLGKHAADLPSSALLFPLLVKAADGTPAVVRTVLSVDEAARTMTFAGDVPVGSTAQLMRANFERIIEAGEGAARASLQQGTPSLALLISCVGRRIILKQRVEDEVDAVRSALGRQVVTTGFYSYGELGAQLSGSPCQLHNQTMTVTSFREV
jgi:hypothetical protein